ncbi:hypothetical protein [Streptomyces agglomeratus]|uniref:hypothetical protein n=1 Tax=Streptomyces agglomeratus TaxID=285458 RepID=UPI000854F6FC|nr:hypothetical protein [Streptomyces agglomeratus]OEJ49657.1 hypothetical protein BGK72_01380 [Streptomyces agglomeratus]
MIDVSHALPARLVPDGTSLTGFNNAYAQAKDRMVPFVCVSQGRGRWTVQADLRTAPGWGPVAGVEEFLHRICGRLVDRGLAWPESSATATSIVLYGLLSEPAARTLASALHAALYGDTKPLTAAQRPLSGP